MSPTKIRRSRDVALGFIFSGFLLFPLYWMVNVSLMQPQDLIRTPLTWLPTDPTLLGYQLAISRNLPAMGTSMVIAAGTVVARDDQVGPRRPPLPLFRAEPQERPPVSSIDR
jgi:ABC-type glycerol-3-phosphate transport system permease component